MNENRYNIFNQIHKALRARLYATAGDIQQTDFAEDNAGATIDKVLQVVDLFDDHARHEDTHLLPLLNSVDAKMVADFEEEHVEDHRLSNALRQHAAAWRSAATAQEKAAQGKALFYAFNAFIAFNLYHMNKEEDALLQTLWQHYTDADLLAVQKNIINSIPPEVMMAESRWMLRSLSNSEIIQWLKGVQLTAPPPAVAALTAMAQQELSSERWEVVAVAVA
ncbi:MAG TPA: hemerythrin domain-containing protein [Chitinophagaceae bacterium]|nr:hemerythrin domain-containing protein [Chitinophagaceae bacterium]